MEAGKQTDRWQPIRQTSEKRNGPVVEKTSTVICVEHLRRPCELDEHVSLGVGVQWGGSQIRGLDERCFWDNLPKLVTAHTQPAKDWRFMFGREQNRVWTWRYKASSLVAWTILKMWRLNVGQTGFWDPGPQVPAGSQNGARLSPTSVASRRVWGDLNREKR